MEKADILPQSSPEGEPIQSSHELPELSDEQKSQLSNYIHNAMIILRHPKTTNDMEMRLKKNKNPAASVAILANFIHDSLHAQAKQQKKHFNNITLFYGGNALIDAIIEFGEERGILDMTEEDKVAARILAFQHYFGRGIKEGRIDPIALQKDMEPLMPKDLREKGQAIYNQSLGPKVRQQEGVHQ